MSEKLWYKVARTIVKAGGMPFPISDTLIELLQLIISDDQAQFITKVFSRKPNLNMDEIKKRIDMPEEEILKILNDLQYRGVISGTKSRTTGITVYRLQPPFPGIFEYQLMRPGEGEREKKLAALFDKLFEEMSSMTSKNYDALVSQYKKFPPVDRVIPVEEEVKVGEDIILSGDDVRKIVEMNEDIAVAYCYCRHEKDLLGEPCKLNAPRENCLLFGKSAQFAIEYDFAKRISKEDTLKILKEAEDVGLVHKAFHVHQDPNRDLEAICNCCPCCCGIFQLYHRGVMPFHTITNYLAMVNKEDCVGCGTCTEMCPMEAIELVDTIASVNENRCIGCGICAHHCPESAIHLKRMESPRYVFLPPPKKATN
ncbi:MAG: 4Fe-4S binding protein [Promethearchaeota archaeon]